MAKRTKDSAGQDIGMSKRLILYISGLVISVLVMVALYSYVAVQTFYEKEYVRLVGEQRLLALHISKYAYQASYGDSASFAILDEKRDEFTKNLNILIDGDEESGLPASPVSLSETLNNTNETWNQFNDKVLSILEKKESMLAMQNSIKSITELMSSLSSLSDEVVSELIRANAGQDQIYIAARQLMLAERIARNMFGVMAGGDETAIAADSIGRDVAIFGRVIHGMLNGNSNIGISRVRDQQARIKVAEVSEKFAQLSEQVGIILQNSPDVFQVKEATSDIISDINDGYLNAIENNLQSLEDGYEALAEQISLISTGGDVSGLLGIVMLVLSGIQLRREGRERLEASESQRKQIIEQNQRNQTAILRLLDELGNLAEGDLTVHATVTEDITGAIADSINYAIDAMRKLVYSINKTTAQVSRAAQVAQNKAFQIAESSTEEAREISEASQSIYIMANTIDDVSRSAADLAEEAKRSVEFAVQGNETVQNTIDGMNNIREQIQDTSKRIKRLGESSQQIGDIVELINDIAEQTNILALNASIQAAMAGESGRGFAVVADEVQQLAERAANSTRQIEALIKTIQTDANEAISSMEESTSGVVSGARLAQDAGESLTKIETVSKSLANLIQSISSSTQEHAVGASEITEEMRHVRDAATQSSEDISSTAELIGELADLSDELKESVAGFKLPE